MKHVKELLKKYIEADNQIPEERDAFVTYMELIAELQEAIEQDEKENGWIPVSDRLPEESDYYMACICNEISNKYCCRSEWLSINDNYYGELVWLDLKSYEKVVAWMPLPELYKEDRS